VRTAGTRSYSGNLDRVADQCWSTQTRPVCVLRCFAPGRILAPRWCASRA